MQKGLLPDTCATCGMPHRGTFLTYCDDNLDGACATLAGYFVRQVKDEKNETNTQRNRKSIFLSAGS